MADTRKPQPLKCYLNVIEKFSESDLESIVADCKVVFNCRSIKKKSDDYSEGATYIVKPNEQPSCNLERLALSIFHEHTKDISDMDPTSSGAEWWTQVIDSRDDIGFHWDRDYGVEEESGDHIYPKVGTVTYLSHTGGPTLIMDKVGGDDETADITGPITSFIASKPMYGKHIAFDGSLLHAAPSDLLVQNEEDSEDDDDDDDDGSGNDSEGNSDGEGNEDEDKDGDEGDEEEDDNENEKNSGNNIKSNTNRSKADSDSDSDNDEGGSDDSDDGHASDSDTSESAVMRVTLLVNIWVNHIPIQSIRFPENKLKCMSKHILGSSNSSNKAPSKSIPQLNFDHKLTGPETVVELNQDNCPRTMHWEFNNSDVNFIVTTPLPVGTEVEKAFEQYHCVEYRYVEPKNCVATLTVSANQADVDSGDDDDDDDDGEGSEDGDVICYPCNVDDTEDGEGEEDGGSNDDDGGDGGEGEEDDEDEKDEEEEEQAPQKKRVRKV